MDRALQKVYFGSRDLTGIIEELVDTGAAVATADVRGTGTAFLPGAQSPLAVGTSKPAPSRGC